MNAVRNWFFPPKEYKLLIIGNDYVGPTTFLSQLKNGKYLETAATEGLSIETVPGPENSRWTLWGASASHKGFWPLFRNYVWNSVGVLYLHNGEAPGAGDSELLQRVLREMQEHEVTNIWFAVNRQDLPEGGEEVDEDAWKWFDEEIAKQERNGGISWDIFQYKLSTKTGEGVQELLRGIHTMANRCGLQEDRAQLPQTSSWQTSTKM